MSLPNNVPEAEFLRVVERVAHYLYAKYGKLHGSREDFGQAVALWALEALPHFCPARPLENYICTHVRNRALNWIRDTHYRSDPPCAKCHAGEPCQEDGSCCAKYAKWQKRNKRKADLAAPLQFGEVAERAQSGTTAEDDVAAAELRQMIDEQLPVELRSDYLRMLAGQSVETDRRRQVKKAVADILGLDEQGRVLVETDPAPGPL